MPEERFLLAALHLGRWSCARLARIFGLPVEQIEALAWGARVRLISSQKGLPYPAGASTQGPNCPEYDSRRPWTQRFLDEEIASGRERLFFQNHLMACESCREALGRCRESYYAIERLLPRFSDEDRGDRQMLRSLEAIAKRSLALRLPADRTFAESLAVFVRRRDIQVVLGILGLTIVWGFFR
jgi:hypothetical protein